jgi:alanine racemase
VPCWLEVDLDAVAGNVQSVKRLVGPSSTVVAVVKAEAYGLGATPVAEAALSAGAEWLAVARVNEGVRLRKAGVTAPILNLAYSTPEEAAALVNHRITPTVVDLIGARAIAAAAPRDSSVPIHLKLDTGLTRFGARPEEFATLLNEIERLSALQVQGIYSHFASADELDQRFTRAQLGRFMTAVGELSPPDRRPWLLHVANTAATLSFPDARLDLVRLGIALSGHYPSPEVQRSCGLTPAIRLSARVARVYELPAGTSVGYGRTYRAARPLRAALIPVGYADGLPRSYSNRAELLLHGRRVPLIGRVSMDQCVVDVTECPRVQPGDLAVLIGKQGEEHISLDEFAAWDQTIPHEALCRIGPRVPRYYLRDGRIEFGPGFASALALDGSLPGSLGRELSNPHNRRNGVHSTSTGISD